MDQLCFIWCHLISGGFRLSSPIEQAEERSVADLCFGGNRYTFGDYCRLILINLVFVAVVGVFLGTQLIVNIDFSARNQSAEKPYIMLTMLAASVYLR